MKKAALKVEPYGMMPGASGPMRGMRGNVRGRGGRGGKDYIALTIQDFYF